MGRRWYPDGRGDHAGGRASRRCRAEAAAGFPGGGEAGASHRAVGGGAAGNRPLWEAPVWRAQPPLLPRAGAPAPHPPGHGGGGGPDGVACAPGPAAG
ncbi:hypothetical protein CKY51_04540, partial [Xanthomonas maliensis]